LEDPKEEDVGMTDASVDERNPLKHFRPEIIVVQRIGRHGELAIRIVTDVTQFRKAMYPLNE
jgi:hypothetical protein